ncbi:pyruvate dehydrogenase E1 component subunit beta [Nakamurella endophytica]|uniref:Pyruvate dehydrogenase E1 component subunit beta n=1 Tax=Nakamurella endophytica TaxID=1748367 RepID=A0A917T8T5_9ACTN|nr:pyruvate dehydrogenase E1 component subunit beta [Nakamurella endophytica]
MRDEMAADPSVCYLGEDVVHSLRGVSSGLAAAHPGRVKDTPISEAAFTGFATGAAMAGMRPIVEYQIPTLLYVAFDQIVNQAQKIRLMTGGQTRVPVTYLFPGSGARLGLAGQHSDHPYTLLAHMGVKTLVPATPQDAYSLVRSAIRDDDPVAVFLPANCLPRKGDVDVAVTVPIGPAAIRREGTDVTVVAIGHLVHEALAVADDLADQVDVEVIDARAAHPFDWHTLTRSVTRTGRLVVLDDTNRTCGWAAEVAATAAEELFHHLRAPVRRVARADVPMPFAPVLERAVVPDREAITAAILETAKA